MCGLSGFLNGRIWNEGAASAEALARAMAQALAHRGPDGDGVLVDAPHRLALSHRRLAIIDRSDAAGQPMTSQSGRHVIVYNGEIFNAAEMGRALAARGIVPRSRSDTEILLECLEALGPQAALERAEGMFAFALWDRREQVLRLARDHVGVKPLYVLQQGDAVAFASEIKALRLWPGFRGDIDPDALGQYLRLGYVPSPLSVYRDVRKVEAGETIVFSRDGTMQAQRFWSLRRERETLADALTDADDDRWLGEAERRVEASITQAMAADVPVGCFLSGGIDSSLIAAVAARHAGQPLRTYAAAFPGHAVDESAHAAAVAAALGCHHATVPVTAGEARDAAAVLADIFDEPLSDMASLPTRILAARARDDVGVVLCGDGGDEAFAGYDRYRRLDDVRSVNGRIPAFVGRALSSAAAGRFGRPMGALAAAVGAGATPAAATARLARFGAAIASQDRVEQYLALISLWDRPEDLTGHRPTRPAAFAAADAAAADHLDFAQLVDCALYLPDALLVKTDRATMAHGLEARVPLASPRVLSCGLALPDRLRRRGGLSKHALRALCYRRLDRALVDRPKQGFTVPMAGWLRGPLRDWAEGLIGRPALIRTGLFDPEPIMARWRAHLDAHVDWSYPLWAILVAQDWALRQGSGQPSGQQGEHGFAQASVGAAR